MRKGKFATVFSNKAADGWGAEVDCDPYRHVLVQVAATNSPDGVLKCWGSGSATRPTWADATSPTNVKATKMMKDLSDGSSVTGDTGVVLDGGVATFFKEFRINTDDLRTLNFELSSYVAGNWWVFIRLINDTRNA